jgi:hypothetical protein
MTSLMWKINRLRLMSVAEVGFRMQQQLAKKLFAKGFGGAYRPPKPRAHFGKSFINGPVYSEGFLELQQKAERILSGKWDIFALKGVEIGFPPVWNRDPKTGITAPLIVGKSLDYRNEEKVGDIKYLWEPGRHLEVVTLALAWRVTGDARYSAGAVALIESWLDQCPYPIGVHWASSLELAVRLLNWSIAWHLLGGIDSVAFSGEKRQFFLDRWLASVYQHCKFIDGFYSRHSSANNHLFGEYMGLYIASVTWPCWEESETWRRRAKDGLETEAMLQTSADGVNREQATYYHHEVMDMMLLSYACAAASGDKFSDKFMDRLECMADYIASLMDAGGNVPMIGDSDDALMTRLAYSESFCCYRSLLASCAILFDRPDLKTQAKSFDEKTLWLFGPSGADRWNNFASVGYTPVRRFDQGGYYILGEKWQSPTEIRALVDCAPLGYLSIAAHGHADALSMLLSVGGHEILIDPGTYAYHTQRKWRDYFRGTGAHNTVLVDDLDQSEIGGSFMWLRKANASLLQFETTDEMQVFEGSHDGYSRLADPVIHRRRIEFDTRVKTFTVTDYFECANTHKIEARWHIGETCTVISGSNSVEIMNSNESARVLITASQASLRLLRGQQASPAGWISRAFDKKIETTTACFSMTIHGNAELKTIIKIEFV